MIRWPHFNSSHRARLLALALTAVLLPVALLSVIQYRSLADLESKTRVAVEENLRQTLQSISRRAKEKLEALAAEALSSIEAADVEQERLDRIESHLTAARESHPEIDLAFLVMHCSCRERNFAVFSAPEGVHRILHDQFKASQEAQAAIESYKNAGLLRAAAEVNQDVLFEQSACSIFPGRGNAHQQVFVFAPLPAADGRGQGGFAGITLKPSYVKEQLLPQVISELLPDAAPGSSPIVSILDELGREVYASRSGLMDREVTMTFAPVFRQWKLGIGYQETTIAALAKKQFRQNLIFTALALLLLILGLILTLRATTREMKLAEAKSTFVSNVSHELKTPLALIRLFAEMLEMGMVRSQQKTQEYGRIINHESRRLTQLINNILDFSRIEAGRREYQFAEADAAEVVAEVLQSYEYQMQSAGFEVKMDFQRNLPPVLIDRDALAQAVLNLLNNAIKYAADDKRIEVRVREREGKIAIEVADHGIGIPLAEQQRIFEKFYRISTGLVHHTKGSGLGLAIVKHIVEAHRGQIHVESAPGRGSRFTILLPARASAAAETESLRPGGYSIAENPHH
jgi:signal transduction histidine kinase